MGIPGIGNVIRVPWHILQARPELVLDADAEFARRGLTSAIRLAEDGFDRNLGATTNLNGLSLPTGQTWQAWLGTLSNRPAANNDTVTGSVPEIAYAFELGTRDCELLYHPIAQTSNAAKRGLLVRGRDANNFLGVTIDGQETLIGLVKREAGGPITRIDSRAPGAAFSNNQGRPVRVVPHGNYIDIWDRRAVLWQADLVSLGLDTLFGEGTPSTYAGLLHYGVSQNVQHGDNFLAAQYQKLLTPSQWSDDSGKGNHFSQATALKQPYLWHDGIRPVMRSYGSFTNSESPILSCANASLLTALGSAQAGTLIIVASLRSVAAGSTVWLGGANSTVSTRFLTIGRSGGNVQIDQRNNDTPQDTCVGSSALAINTPYIFTLRVQAGLWTLQVNDLAGDTLSFSSGANNGDWFGDIANMSTQGVVSLFGKKTSAESLFANLDIMGVVYTNEVLT